MACKQPDRFPVSQSAQIPVDQRLKIPGTIGRKLVEFQGGFMGGMLARFKISVGLSACSGAFSMRVDEKPKLRSP